MQTKNPDYGFHGTIARSAFALDAARAFENAVTQLAMRTKGSPEGCRDYLDSRDGRHLADMVLGTIMVWTGRGEPLTDEMVTRAIRDAITASQKWTITYQMAREYGIQHGQPYLTAWVRYYTTLAGAHSAAE